VGPFDRNRKQNTKENDMREASGLIKLVGLPFGAALAGSFAVLLLGLCAFGFHVAHWAEWQCRTVGVISTLAAVVGATIGLLRALRGARQTAK